MGQSVENLDVALGGVDGGDGDLKMSAADEAAAQEAVEADRRRRAQEDSIAFGDGPDNPNAADGNP